MKLLFWIIFFLTAYFFGLCLSFQELPVVILTLAKSDRKIVSSYVSWLLGRSNKVGSIIFVANHPRSQGRNMSQFCVTDNGVF
jgi:hypothetical protein